jgi:hypothetical protein
MKPITVTSNWNKVIVSEIDFGGKQLGKLNGSPGFGNIFFIRGVFIFELIEINKIKNIRSYYDSKSIYKQLQILKF